MAPQRCGQPVLVAAQRDHRRGRKEDASTKPVAVSRQRLHVSIARRDDEIDARLAYEPRDRRGKPGCTVAVQQVTLVGGRPAEHETIVVAAEEHERGIRRPKAAKQILGRGAAGAHDQNPWGAHSVRYACNGSIRPAPAPKWAAGVLIGRAV